MLQTTIAGSLPKPGWLAETEKLWPAWRLEGDALRQGKERAAATIRSALAFVDPQRLFPCNNCGMTPIPYDVARGKLESLGAGAALVRKQL